MKNLAVKLTADIGGYTTNMELASRVGRERMGQASAAVDDFQLSVNRSSDELARAAKSMGSNMQAANDAIMRSANTSSEAISAISESANEVEFKSLGEKVSSALGAGVGAAKKQLNEFAEWSESKSKVLGVAIGLVLAGTIAGAAYTAYKVIKGTANLIEGLFTGETYKNANIDELIAANKEVKDIQESLRLSAQDAGALQLALSSLGAPKADYVAVYQAAEKAIRGNTEELDRLGVKYKDAKGNLLPLEQVVRNASAALDTYTEGWDRNSAATAIGIGTTAQIAAALSVNSEAIEKSRQRINDYNLGIGPEAQAAVDRYQKAMTAFRIETDLTSQGFKRALADNVMPLLTDLAEWFTDGWPKAVSAFRFGLATVNAGFYILKTTVFGVAEIIVGSLSAVTSLIGGIGAASAMLMKGDFTAAKDVLVAGWDDAKKRLAQIGLEIEANARHSAAAIHLGYGSDDRAKAGAARPLGGNRFVPKPDDATTQRDDVDKAIMEGALKAQEAIIAAEKAQLTNRQQFLQGYYQQEYLTAHDYYGTKQRLILDALKVELDAYDKEIAALEVYKATRGKDTAGREEEKGRQDADNRIAEVRAKIAAAVAKSNHDVTASLIDRNKIQRDFELSSRDWNRQETLSNDALQFGIDMMGKNTIEVAKATAARRIQLAVEERIYALRKKDPEADVSQALADAAEKSTTAQRLIEEQALKQRDGWFGATEAIRKYAEAAGDLGSQVDNALSTAFRNAEEAVVQFVKTGKVDFKGFADSVISDLIRMQVRASITAPLSAAITNSGGIGGFFSSLFSGGGQPEQLGFSASQLSRMSVPSYDLGTDYVPRTGLALIHEGEKITPRGERGDDWGGGVTIINNYDNRGVDPMVVTRLEARLEAQRRDTYNLVVDAQRRRSKS